MKANVFKDFVAAAKEAKSAALNHCVDEIIGLCETNLVQLTNIAKIYGLPVSSSVTFVTVEEVALILGRENFNVLVESQNLEVMLLQLSKVLLICLDNKYLNVQIQTYKDAHLEDPEDVLISITFLVKVAQ